MAKYKPPNEIVLNCVPMIDVGMQLIMFFILATNYVSADLDKGVALPDLDEQESRAVEEKSPFKLYLNLLVDPNAPNRLLQMKAGIFDITAEAIRRGGAHHDAAVLREILEKERARTIAKGGKLILVIRADKRVPFREIQKVMMVAVQPVNPQDPKQGVLVEELRLAAPTGEWADRH